MHFDDKFIVLVRRYRNSPLEIDTSVLVTGGLPELAAKIRAEALFSGGCAEVLTVKIVNRKSLTK